MNVLAFWFFLKFILIIYPYISFLTEKSDFIIYYWNTFTKKYEIILFISKNIDILVGGGDFGRNIPVYPIWMSNVLNTIKSTNDKTNNSLESWHKVSNFDRFEYPKFNKIIKNIKVERKLMHIAC
jgi:hypothetical protein